MNMFCRKQSDLQNKQEQLWLKQNAKMNNYTYEDWLDYFKQNDSKRLEISFADDTLTAEERNIIFPSVCYFQRGEKSDGTHLLKAASRFARTTGNAAYNDCIRLFIKEENMHSAYLKRYMEHYAVPEKNTVVLDSLFRRLRKSAGLQCEVLVLVTAEMIALSYYDALGNACRSQTLKRICRQMLHDEIPHILFQSHTLSYCRKSPCIDFFRIVLMEAASAAVWAACHNVFRAGGWTLARFLRTNLCCLRQSIALSKKQHPHIE